MRKYEMVFPLASLVFLLAVTSCSATGAEPLEITPSPSASSESPVKSEDQPTAEGVEAESEVVDLSAPPFSGTVYITPDVLTPSSVSDFLELGGYRQEQRTSFDRRLDDWITAPMHVFLGTYGCSQSVEILVNNEFSFTEAEAQAVRFARVLGQIPLGSRENILELWIHSGDFAAGGGNQSILIHTDLIDREPEFVEELFLHEAAHTSLDPEFAGVVDSMKWAEAAAQDEIFVSSYAADYPQREDIAESFGAFQIWATAAKVKSLEESAKLVAAAMPARISYFESLGSSFLPFAGKCE